jgi:hypothetical protein
VQIDREALSRHYASLSDEELLYIDPAELTEVAQECYDREFERRKLTSEPVAEDASPRHLSADAAGGHDAFEPDWLESASCACSFLQAGASYAGEVDEACEVLHAAGIPCEVVGEEPTEEGPGLIKVMVPAVLNLKANSVLDRDLYNPKLEVEWKALFQDASDSELKALRPDVICAGLLDRAARLRRIYEEEVARRKAAGGVR